MKEHEDFNFKGWLVLDSSWTYQPTKIKALQVCIIETSQMARIPNIIVVETSNFAECTLVTNEPSTSMHQPMLHYADIVAHNICFYKHFSNLQQQLI